MLRNKLSLLGAVAAAVASTELLYSRPSNPRHWNAEPDEGVTTEVDSDRLAAAQAKRARKNAKRLRDAGRLDHA